MMGQVEFSNAGMGIQKFCAFRDLGEPGMLSAAGLVERNRLVMEHLPVVRALAVQIRRRLPAHVEVDDLIQAGTMGLLDAVNKCDPRKAGAFGTYARHRIRGAILDSLRRSDWASRSHRRNHRRMEEAVQELSTSLQRAPTEAEVAARLGMSLELWRSMLTDLRIQLISMSRSQDAEDSRPMDFADKAENQPESLYARSQLFAALEGAIKTLPEREQRILDLYYRQEIPMRAISQMFGVHQSRVSQILRAAVKKTAKALKLAGIRSSQAA